MNEFLIKNYISRLTQDDINGFAKKHGIDLNEDELKLIEQHIRKDWHTIIYGNPRPILDNLKTKLKNNEYQKIENLYVEFKNKYKNYL
ncbi:MAG: hypothetical protein ACI31V_02040 [Bacilli bacterium]